jgi:hypothetical protein
MSRIGPLVDVTASLSRAAPRLVLAFAVTVLAGPGAAAIPATPDGKTGAAVLAVDRAWGAAEEMGDAAFVSWLLEPDYRSVGVEGKATARATIVAHVQARSDAEGAQAKRREADVAAWKAEHPERAEAKLFGDTAVVTWVSTKPGKAGLVYSCDVFVYRQKHWHAAYSQHTAA